MENTILDKYDIEEYSKQELYDLYYILIGECRNRNLKDKEGRYI